MAEFTEIFTQLSFLLSDVDTSKYTIAYRGVPDVTWEDVPSLFRNNNLHKEKMSIEEIIRQYPDEFSHAHTIDVLTQLQHFGCPTRMLDVTSNILVALFFACGGWDMVCNKESYKSKSNKDGELRVYMVKNEDVKSIDSETVTLLSNIARLKDEDKFGLLPWLCEKDLGVWQSDEDQIKQNAEDVNSVVLVKTKLNNPRIRAQYGSFFLFGGLSGLEYYHSMNEMELRGKIVKKHVIPFPSRINRKTIYIPSHWKEHILELLDKYMGIRFSTICPEKQDFIKTIM